MKKFLTLISLLLSLMLVTGCWDETADDDYDTPDNGYEDNGDGDSDTDDTDNMDDGSDDVEDDDSDDDYDKIQIDLEGGAEVTSPLVVEGEIPGNWYFEAQTIMEIQDEDGNVLASSAVVALDEWMTTDPVPFEVTLNFDVETETEATLVIHKANASGLAEHDDSFKWDVTLMPSS